MRPTAPAVSWFNRQRFVRVLMLMAVLNAVFYLSGCTSAWLATVSSLLPGISSLVSAVVAFVAGLEGKTVSSQFVAAVKQWEQNVATEIANAQSIIAQIKQNATSGLVQQFQAAMTAISQSFSSILAGVNVTDQATVAKLTEFLQLGIAAVNSVLALIPGLSQALAAGPHKEIQLAALDKLGARQTFEAHTVMNDTYKAILEEETTNEDVNAVLATLPTELASK